MKRLGWHRYAVQAAVDVLGWAFALGFGTLVRYDFSPASVSWGGLAATIPLAGLAQTVAGIWCGLYTGRWRFGSFDEVAALARAVALTALLVVAADLWVLPHRMVPVSATLGGAVAALVLMGGARYLWRLALEARRRPTGEGCERLLVFGAGDAGAQIVTAMLRDPTSPYLPVALLDDDPARRDLRMMGLHVAGDRHQLIAAAERYEADGVLVAIPSAGADVVGEITDLATQADLTVKVLPAVSELFDDRVGVGDIRDLSEVDLLGRHQVDTEVEAIADYLTGKRVLVTGAGGSIGSELCRQVYRFAPAELVMLDRDESALHDVQVSIHGRSAPDSPNLALVDLRDRAELERLFAQRRPEVVFHAAALKHVAMLERHPAEAVKTNVWGTLTVLEVAAASGVERFVNISTDKAADPCNVLGYTKRIGERLTAWFSANSAGTCLSVRFGNVLGSRGSVLTTFRAQIDVGGPVTVTDPEATRYFMTVEEAVQLVIQAGAIGRDGEVLVLDMGDPVRIADLASRLAANAERPIEIVYTGLLDGEKLHEVRFGPGETDNRPSHPLISHVQVQPLAPVQTRALDATASPKRTAESLQELSPVPCVGVSSAN